MSELVFKSLLLVATASSVFLSLSPPNPPINDKERSGGNTLFDRYVRGMAATTRHMAWIVALYDFIVMTSIHQHSPIAHTICPNAAALTVTPWLVSRSLLFGALSTSIGSLIRMWCFAVMGQFFTFEVTIKPDHELVKRGPYGWVRHPSYTGLLMMLGGFTATMFAPESAVMSCGIISRGAFVWVGIWAIQVIVATQGVMSRLTAEDKVLREKFGSKWDSYAKNVPRKLVPGVF